VVVLSIVKTLSFRRKKMDMIFWYLEFWNVWFKLLLSLFIVWKTGVRVHGLNSFAHILRTWFSLQIRHHI
jgi:hypothetical protein